MASAQPSAAGIIVAEAWASHHGAVLCALSPSCGNCGPSASGCKPVIVSALKSNFYRFRGGYVCNGLEVCM